VSACRLAETFVGARSRAMLSLVSAFGAKSFQGTSFQSRSFRLPAAAEVLLFCLSKREVPKRKRPPAWRLPPIHGRQVRESGPGFSSGLLPARKGVAIPGNARCAACRPRLTAAQGTPGRAAGHPGPHSVMKLKSNGHSKAALCCGFAPALDLALLKSARWERAALPVAHPRTRRAGEGMDARVEATQGVVARCPQGAPSGWPFSWVTFSLATQRESDSVAEGDRPLLILNAAKARASRTSALLQLQARQFSAAAAAKHATGAVA
jgi:hypothetical protein